MMGIIKWIGIITMKRNLTPCLHISDMNGGQAGTKSESLAFYARHAARNRDGGQAAAITESIFSYARYAMGNTDGGQTAAMRENITADGRHS